MKVGIVILVSVAIIYLTLEVKCEEASRDIWAPFKKLPAPYALEIYNTTDQKGNLILLNSYPIISFNKSYETPYIMNPDAKVYVDVWFKYVNANNRMKTLNFFGPENPNLRSAVKKLVDDINRARRNVTKNLVKLETELQQRHEEESDVHVVNYAFKLFLSSFRLRVLDEDLTKQLRDYSIFVTMDELNIVNYKRAVQLMQRIKEKTHRYILKKTLDVIHQAIQNAENGMNIKQYASELCYLLAPSEKKMNPPTKGVVSLIKEYSDIGFDKNYYFFSKKFERETKVGDIVFGDVFEWTEIRKTFLSNICNYLINGVNGERPAINDNKFFTEKLVNRPDKETKRLRRSIMDIENKKNRDKYIQFNGEEYPTNVTEKVVILLQDFLRHFTDENAIIPETVFKEIKVYSNERDTEQIVNILNNKLLDGRMDVLIEILNLLSIALRNSDEEPNEKEDRLREMAKNMDKCLHDGMSSKKDPEPAIKYLLKFYDQSNGHIIRSREVGGIKKLEYEYKYNPKRMRVRYV